MPHSRTIIDCRSPAEYEKAHIPGAVNLPLFSDEERAMVGTNYKQVGREAAVKLGLRFVGPKLHALVTTAEEFAPDKKVTLYCWRGGMRSASLAWLLETAGFDVERMEGGYKTYRHWVSDQFSKTYPMRLIGGMTGAGKTAILHHLHDRGESILDLEGLAAHRGSAYGHLGQAAQPSQEMFENILATALSESDAPLWIEAESRMIGHCKIPDPFFEQMDTAPLFHVERPVSERVERLVDEYGQASKEALIAATEKLSRKLGGERTAQAMAFIHSGEIKRAVETILPYYDKTYTHSTSSRSGVIIQVEGAGLDDCAWAELLVEKSKEKKRVSELLFPWIKKEPAPAFQR